MTEPHREPPDDWDIADAAAADIDHAATVAGTAAYVVARLWLPDRETAEQDLDRAGIRGNPQAEFIRQRVLESLDSIKRRGAEWHAARHGAEEVSGETRPVSRVRYSKVMNDDTMTTAEAAERLGCSDVNVRKLARGGGLRGHKSPATGAWVLDRASVEARAR